MKILLDAGHGGKDPGAINPHSKRKEKDITLEVVLALGNKLRDIGHDVLYTRDKDIYISPDDRRKMINEFMPDAFISIHCNASTNTDAHGIETIYRDDNDYELARQIHKYLLIATGMKDRGMKQDITQLNRKLAVLSGNPKVSACLVEIGFISNDRDIDVIDDENLIASAIVEGIRIWA